MCPLVAHLYVHLLSVRSVERVIGKFRAASGAHEVGQRRSLTGHDELRLEGVGLSAVALRGVSGW